jgi:type IV pilus assembly protein PilN
MPNINLRPWREEERAQRQKEFGAIAILVVIVAVGLSGLWTTHVDAMISEQKSRNAYITSSMKVLDKKIKEIKELREQKTELLARMQVIQDLQGTRPIIVRIFDELVKTLPEDLYYTELTRTTNNLAITGMADSNNRISSLMRNFDASEWFANPNLKDVRKAAGNSNQFEMTVDQVTPVVVEEEGGAQ